MKPTIIFLINSIDIIRGGLTRASLKQAKFFSELGYETLMVTFNFNPKYPKIRHELLRLGRITEDIKILNMYEELEGHTNPIELDKPIKKASLTELSEGNPYDKREGYNAYRVYKNGIYYKYIDIKKDGSLNFIDYFNENRYRTKREDYDMWGNLKKVTFMDYNNNRPRQLVYYNVKGEAYFTQWNNPQNDVVQRIHIFENNLIKKVTKDNITHKTDWLSSLIDNIENDKVVVVSDTRSTDDVLLNLNNQKVAKVWRLHSSHLSSPYTTDSKISPKVENALSNIDKFDAGVFLTEEQKSDIHERFGLKDNLTVIPHYHPVKKIAKGIKRDENLAIVISRFSTLKRIDHSILAFGKVVKKIPNAKLEIWGTGDQEKVLKKLINELELEKSVFLKGFTQYPDELYQKALFSILTSKSEGFSLAVLESMSNCTPVLSYNIKYGPADMIKNGDNGFLIKNGDIDELAEKMIYMFENPKNARSFGLNAKEYIDHKFNKEIYKEKWLETIDLALRNKFSK